MTCDCGDRAWWVLTRLGFCLEDGLIVWTTRRGRVLLDIDLKAHPTRTTLLALLTRIVL